VSTQAKTLEATLAGPPAPSGNGRLDRSQWRVFVALVLDTVQEARARWLFWGLFGLSTLLILFFLFVLKIDLELTVKHSQPEGRKKIADGMIHRNTRNRN
jgi:hypothetical protein